MTEITTDVLINSMEEIEAGIAQCSAVRKAFASTPLEEAHESGIAEAGQFLEKLARLAAEEGVHKVRIPHTTTDAWVDRDTAEGIAMDALGDTGALNDETGVAEAADVNDVLNDMKADQTLKAHIRPVLANRTSRIQSERLHGVALPDGQRKTKGPIVAGRSISGAVIHVRDDQIEAYRANFVEMIARYEAKIAKTSETIRVIVSKVDIGYDLRARLIEDAAKERYEARASLGKYRRLAQLNP